VAKPSIARATSNIAGRSPAGPQPDCIGALCDILAEAAINTPAATADGRMPGAPSSARLSTRVNIARSDERRESGYTSLTERRSDPGGHRRYCKKQDGKISAVVNCNGFAAGITMSSIEPGSIFFHSTRSARGAADRDKDRPRSLSLCLELDQCIGREIGYHKPIDEPGSDVHRNGATQV
jgi:hypothetical protein